MSGAGTPHDRGAPSSFRGHNPRSNWNYNDSNYNNNNNNSFNSFNNNNFNNFNNNFCDNFTSNSSNNLDNRSTSSNFNNNFNNNNNNNNSNNSHSNNFTNNLDNNNLNNNTTCDPLTRCNSNNLDSRFSNSSNSYTNNSSDNLSNNFNCNNSNFNSTFNNNSNFRDDIANDSSNNLNYSFTNSTRNSNNTSSNSMNNFNNNNCNDASYLPNNFNNRGNFDTNDNNSNLITNNNNNNSNKPSNIPSTSSGNINLTPSDEKPPVFSRYPHGSSFSTVPSQSNDKFQGPTIDQRPSFDSLSLPSDKKHRITGINQGMAPRLNSVMQPRIHPNEYPRMDQQSTTNQGSTWTAPQLNCGARPRFQGPIIHHDQHRMNLDQPKINQGINQNINQRMRSQPASGQGLALRPKTVYQEMDRPMNPVMTVRPRFDPVINSNMNPNMTTVSKPHTDISPPLTPAPPPVHLPVPPPSTLLMNNSTAPILMQAGPNAASKTNVSTDGKEEYKETMAEIVSLWIKSRDSLQSTDNNATKSLLNLGELSVELKTLSSLLEQLRQFNDELAGKMDAEQEEWIQLVVNINKIKSQVTELQTKLFNPEQLEFTENQLTKRKKKRDGIRKQKKRRREQYIASLSTRIKLNEQIDEAIQKQRTNIAMEKMKESVKNEAGESLVHVKRKQKLISENMTLLKLLDELREARKETAIYKGIFVTEKDDERFNRGVEETLKVLSQQHDVCKEEERCLRVLREEEAEQINRVEKEKRKKRKQTREDQLSSVDPMYPFRLYWLQGEETVQGLIHVRTMWDVFLCPVGTPEGSRIPKTFVPPNSSPSSEWSKFKEKELVKDNSRRNVVDKL